MNSGVSKSNVILLVVLLLSALYLVGLFDRGWVPHDEGALAQTAERVLKGEFPHRDFDDIYTGGLAFLHSLAFRVFGLRLLSLRLVLLIFSLAFVAAVYRIASRAVSPIISGFITLLSLAWSLPNYFAGLPSWYNLFLAVFGILAIFKHIETRKKYWLFIAGVLGGLSFLVKLTGLYYVAAGLLFLIYQEQLLASDTRDSTHSRAFALLTGAGLLIFGGLLVFLIYPYSDLMAILHFLVPGFTLIVFLLWSERKLGCGTDQTRWRRLAGLIIPFISGVILPVLLFIIPYLVTSSLDELFRGVFILPARRVRFTFYPLPPVSTLVAVLPLTLLLIVPFFKKYRRVKGYLLILVTVICGLLLVLGGKDMTYRVFLYSARPIIPLVTIIGCIFLARDAYREELNYMKRQRIFLLLTMAAVMSLIQFPHTQYIYFCYVAPLAILAILFLVADRKGSPRRLMVCFALCYLLFALIWLNRSSLQSGGMGYVRAENTVPLGIKRGGLRVTRPFAEIYRRLVSQIDLHSLPGDSIYASQDCPEVYFLSGRKNPTRTLFDFFDSDFQSNPRGRNTRILKMIEELKINLVVVHWHGDFSGWINHDYLKEIEARFPHRVDLEIFTIFWREVEDSEY